ncbi:MAG: ABC transporter ATP-binding protein [Opitutales bacterium]|nr:ABC transporter ATP-binding protein [Opitutales bacterium]MBQ2721661.1 ABC transporter ATP-binding protein [Opitutales bacterium]
MNLLDVRNLKIKFCSRGIETEAVKSISFSLRENESVAIVGESGSGKTVTAMSLTKLLPPPPTCTVEGDIIFDGKNIADIDNAQLRKIRGRQISYIFQEPSTSLNPVFTIGFQIAEAIKLHFPEEKNVRKLVVESLREVGIRDPEKRYDSYPHELSGGMQQRAMIAMALSCRPRLLVADEPTTALDVTIQKQIIDLLKSVREKRKNSLLLITHNFGIISELCERVIVMFRGNIVEEGLCKDVLYNPQHPYTKALINCVPRLNSNKKLEPIDYDKIK